MSGSLTAKILPPSIPPPHVPRRSLEERLNEGLRRRLTLVVAGAGFGKSTLLSAWAASSRCAWYTVDRADDALATFGRGLTDSLRLRLPGLRSDLIRAVDGTSGPGADEHERAEALAAVLAEGLDKELTGDLILVLDDVDEIQADAPGARLIAELCRQAPPLLHVVLSSRAEPPFAVERLRGRGQVLDLDASALAFSEAEIAALLADAFEGDSGGLVRPLRDLTDGWPAAVRLAVEAFAGAPPDRRAETLEGLRRPGGPIFAYLAEEVFAKEPDEVRELVRRMAVLDRFTPELCEALGIAGAEKAVVDLARRGLFLEPNGAEDGWFSVSQIVKEFALGHLPLDDAERRGIHGQAGSWLEERGLLAEAVHSYVEASDHAAAAEALHRSGARILTSGGAETVIRAAEAIPSELRVSFIDQLEGEARQVRGDWEGALVCFARAAEGSEELPPALAWRMGLIHYLRGNLDEALRVYARGRIGGGDRHDEALLLAWTATVHWIRGEADTCRLLAGQALESANEARDPQALAAAHTTLAMLAALDGDRRGNDAHYVRALEAAEHANDVLQIIRIRTNRSSHFNEEGAYRDALRELDAAIRLAELTGFTVFLALGLSNRAEARLHMGSLDEALADFAASRAAYRRMGARDTYPLAGMGDVYRERGDLALARASYEESLRLAEEVGDLQGLVPALAGLARVLAVEDPEEAKRLAERAIAAGPGLGYVQALLAGGWVALSAHDHEQASRFAVEASDAARARRDRPGLAEALVVRALSSPDPAAETDRLEEAVQIFRETEDPLGQAKVELILGSISGDRDRGERAERRLEALGIRSRRFQAAGTLAALGPDRDQPVAIQALGGLRVLRKGRPVSAAEWQSKKARDLLKILIARRGRPVPRDFLMEALWPEEDPEKLANRLSVALTTVRSVLDPDRRFPPDRFITADNDTVELDPSAVRVDVDDFLTDAGLGLDLARQGRTDDALPVLREAELVYSGDFLEENAYDDWAVPLREEARATYIAVVRTLAAAAAARGDYDAAARHYLRVIERDPYDEEAHLGLVSVLAAAGRHGESRRHYRTYRARMEDLGVEPAPFPSGGRASFTAR